MNRLTDDDRNYGPVTFARASWIAWRCVWSSGDDEYPGNSLTVYAFGWIARIALPDILRPLRIKHSANWDAATVERMGRNYYFEEFPREYGFSLSEGFLTLFLGPQTHDSINTKSWSWFLPWKQWRHVRFSLYGTDGTHFWTHIETTVRGLGHYDEQRKQQEACPYIEFDFDDYDGQRIRAKCHIEEREWRFGDGWFKWLSLFHRAKIERVLSLEFDKEVGPEKGSWKGGTVGHSTEIKPGESCESAFRRYCDQDHRSKYRPYRIKFVGAVPT